MTVCRGWRRGRGMRRNLNLAWFAHDCKCRKFKRGTQTSDSLGCWNSGRQMLPYWAGLRIHDALWSAVVSYFVVTQVMWVFRSAGGYNNPLCLIIQRIMWGRAGPEVTAAPCVKQSCTGINMQMTQDDTTGYSHVHFGNQSAVFWRRELTIIGRSSAHGWWTVSVVWRAHREATRSWRIALGTNNVGRQTTAYFL